MSGIRGLVWFLPPESPAQAHPPSAVNTVGQWELGRVPARGGEGTVALPPVGRV